MINTLAYPASHRQHLTGAVMAIPAAAGDSDVEARTCEIARLA
jgi:hypothetical protein